MPLDKLLKGYHDRNFIIKGFKEGFKVGYVGSFPPNVAKNAKTVNENPQAALDKINEEISLGRISGPHASPPLTNLTTSPLALRPKRNSVKFRLLHNLSSPYDGTSVNFNIPDVCANVKFATITDAVKIILDNKFCFIAKSDIADAFRLIPLHPSDYHLMGFILNKKYYFDKCLPMGCRSSCNIFERFSDAIVYILKTRYKILNVVKYLDDFLFFGVTEKECRQALHCFRDLAKEINLPIAEHKTVGPDRIITFLGYEIDTVQKMIRIPQEKILEDLMLIRAVIKAEHISLRDLKAIIGKLGFAANVISAGKTFLRRLHDSTKGSADPNRVVYLTIDQKKDLLIWEKFLIDFNGKTLFQSIPALLPTTITLCSDSSKSGFGGVCHPYWFKGVFPPNWAEFDIQYLELFPIFLHFMLYTSLLKGKHVKVLTDNQPIVYVLNSLSSKNKSVMSLLRPLVLQLLSNNILITAIHLPGKKNKICDFLSRRQVDLHFIRENGLYHTPTLIPLKLRPHNFRVEDL